MSTADSCLLSVSSILVKDVVARAKKWSPERAEQLGRWPMMISVATMSILMLVAMRPITTLWGLVVIKFEILIQLSPAFVLGTLRESGEPNAFEIEDILPGLLGGLGVTLALYLSGFDRVFGLNAGTIGVGLNYLVVLYRRRARVRRRQQEIGERREGLAA